MEIDDDAIRIFVDGYGCRGIDPNFGSVVEVEVYNDELHSLVRPDIADENTRLISLEGAKEANRSD